MIFPCLRARFRPSGNVNASCAGSRSATCVAAVSRPGGRRCAGACPKASAWRYRGGAAAVSAVAESVERPAPSTGYVPGGRAAWPEPGVLAAKISRRNRPTADTVRCLGVCREHPESKADAAVCGRREAFCGTGGHRRATGRRQPLSRIFVIAIPARGFLPWSLLRLTPALIGLFFSLFQLPLGYTCEFTDVRTECVEFAAERHGKLLTGTSWNLRWVDLVIPAR